MFILRQNVINSLVNRNLLFHIIYHCFIFLFLWDTLQSFFSVCISFEWNQTICNFSQFLWLSWFISGMIFLRCSTGSDILLLNFFLNVLLLSIFGMDCITFIIFIRVKAYASIFQFCIKSFSSYCFCSVNKKLRIVVWTPNICNTFFSFFK